MERAPKLEHKKSSGTLRHLQWSVNRPTSYGKIATSAAVEIAIPREVPPPPQKKHGAWEEHMDEESGLPFYHNRATGESVWQRPAALNTLPGLSPYQVQVEQKGPKRQGTGGASFGNDGGMRPDQF